MSLNPSERWNQKERTAVVVALTMRLRDLATEGITPREQILDLTERAIYVLLKPSRFLEDNRKNILDGQWPDSISIREPKVAQ